MSRTARTKKPKLTQPETLVFHAATQELVRRAEAYGKKRKLTSAQVSKKVFKHTDRIDALKTGKSFLAPDTYEAALSKLSELESEAA